MAKTLNKWLDEFVENGASPNRVTEWPDEAGGGGTTVVANPTLAGTEANLTGLQVGDTKFAVPQGDSGSLYGISFTGISSDGTKYVAVTFITRNSYGLIDPTDPEDTEAQYSTQSGTDVPLTQDMLNELINFEAFPISMINGFVDTEIGGGPEGQHNNFTFIDTEENEVASIKFTKPTGEDCYVENELGYLRISIQVI